MSVPKVFVASMPRSGNSLIRKLFESITGIVTGSNFTNHSIMNFSLAFQGFKGEGYIDDSIWMVKSHFPLYLPFVTYPHSGSKSLVIVRNPYDSIVSLF